MNWIRSISCQIYIFEINFLKILSPFQRFGRKSIIERLTYNTDRLVFNNFNPNHFDVNHFAQNGFANNLAHKKMTG